MASSLSSADTSRLSRALATWKRWPAAIDARPEFVQELGGASNTNVLVSSGEQQFVVRLDRDSAHLGVDRQVERLVLEDIRGRWFSPPIVYIGDEFLVTQYVRADKSNLDPIALALLLKDIHETPTQVVATLDPVLHATQYLSQVEALPTDLQAIVDYALAAPVPESTSPRLSHLDLMPANIIVANDRPIVIDWEYARLAHPAYDIAVVIEGFGLDESDSELLIGQYGIDHADVQRMRQLYLLIEGLWWTLVGRPAPRSWRRLEALLD